MWSMAWWKIPVFFAPSLHPVMFRRRPNVCHLISTCPVDILLLISFHTLHLMLVINVCDTWSVIWRPDLVSWCPISCIPTLTMTFLIVIHLDTCRLLCRIGPRPEVVEKGYRIQSDQPSHELWKLSSPHTQKVCRMASEWHLYGGGRNRVFSCGRQIFCLSSEPTTLLIPHPLSHR